MPVSMNLSVWDEGQTRSLSFPHQRHGSLECTGCHQGTEKPAGEVCANCHENHHREGARCIACHQAAPADTHPIEVHEEGCADCHGDGIFPAIQKTRNFCIVCHQDRIEHNADENCVECHL
jgi:hypothetical protein